MYQHVFVGNLNIKAKTENTNVTLTGKLDGNGNNADITGSYANDIADFKVNFNPLSMSSIQPFVNKTLTRSEGHIYGPVNITGNVNDLRWNGELRFDKVKTYSAVYGTAINIDNQKLILNYPTVAFSNFTITDTAANTLMIDGSITQDAKKNFTSNLAVTA